MQVDRTSEKQQEEREQARVGNIIFVQLPLLLPRAIRQSTSSTNQAKLASLQRNLPRRCILPIQSTCLLHISSPLFCSVSKNSLNQKLPRFRGLIDHWPKLDQSHWRTLRRNSQRKQSHQNSRKGIWPNLHLQSIFSTLSPASTAGVHVCPMIEAGGFHVMHQREKVACRPWKYLPAWLCLFWQPS